MKKYVLFMVLFIASIFVFGQTDKEISEVIIKRGNLDSLFQLKNSQMAEIEKDGWRAVQQTDEFRREVPQLSVRIVSEASAVSVGGDSKSPSLLKILIWAFVFALFFIFVPIIGAEWSMYRPRPRKKY